MSKKEANFLKDRGFKEIKLINGKLNMVTNTEMLIMNILAMLLKNVWKF